MATRMIGGALYQVTAHSDPGVRIPTSKLMTTNLIRQTVWPVGSLLCVLLSYGSLLITNSTSLAIWQPVAVWSIKYSNV